jgi:hypothetical protein
MEINEQTVSAYSEILRNPQLYKLTFRPIAECFKPSESVTSQSDLFKSWIADEAVNCEKIFFYITMAEIFGQPTDKDDKGSLGWKLEYIPAKKS